MNIPILVIHKSEQDYVVYALRSARNYGNEVTIITDVQSVKYAEHASVTDIQNYKNEQTQEFSKIYKHLSSNSYDFEYICIERWFLLLEYMRSRQLEKIIHIDSDVLVYENLTKIIDQYYAAYDVCLCRPDQKHEDFSWSVSGHISYWTHHALEQFCDFILDIYTNSLDKIMLKWQWHQENNIVGGICDMTLLYLFQKETGLKCGNFLHATEDGFCFDNALKSGSNEHAGEYEMQPSFLLGYDIKKISFNDGIPSVYNRLQQKKIRFYALHCQSESKRLMQVLIRDKKDVSVYLSDNLKTLKLFYGAIRRMLSGR